MGKQLREQVQVLHRNPKTPRLTSTQRFVLLTLADEASDSFGGACHISINELTLRTSASRATVMRALSALAAHGLIVKDPIVGDVSIYWVKPFGGGA
jgi:hypothetical protein